MFIVAHYLQQLDLSRLIVVQNLIQRCQDSLQSYFLSQKDGVIIYFNDIKANETKREEDEPVPRGADSDSFWPTLMLKNVALKNIIGIDFDSLTANRAYQPKIFSFASQNDFGNSLGKLDHDETTSLQGSNSSIRSGTFSLFELLKFGFANKTEQVFVKVTNPSNGEEKILDVGFQPLTYVNTDAVLVTMRDITEIRKFSKI